MQFHLFSRNSLRTFWSTSFHTRALRNDTQFRLKSAKYFPLLDDFFLTCMQHFLAMSGSICHLVHRALEWPRSQRRSAGELTPWLSWFSTKQTLESTFGQKTHSHDYWATNKWILFFFEPLTKIEPAHKPPSHYGLTCFLGPLRHDICDRGEAVPCSRKEAKQGTIHVLGHVVCYNMPVQS